MVIFLIYFHVSVNGKLLASVILIGLSLVGTACTENRERQFLPTTTLIEILPLL